MSRSVSALQDRVGTRPPSGSAPHDQAGRGRTPVEAETGQCVSRRPGARGVQGRTGLGWSRLGGCVLSQGGLARAAHPGDRDELAQQVGSGQRPGSSEGPGPASRSGAIATLTEDDTAARPKRAEGQDVVQSRSEERVPPRLGQAKRPRSAGDLQMRQGRSAKGCATATASPPGGAGRVARVGLRPRRVVPPAGGERGRRQTARVRAARSAESLAPARAAGSVRLLCPACGSGQSEDEPPGT